MADSIVTVEKVSLKYKKAVLTDGPFIFIQTVFSV